MAPSGTVARARRHRPKSAELYRLLQTSGAKPARPVTARLVASRHHYANLGGGEIQAAETARALESAGVDVRSAGDANFAGHPVDGRVLHLFGSRPDHLGLAQAAHSAGARVVLSPVAWFDYVARWRECGPLWRRAWQCTSLWARRAFPNLPDWRRRLYLASDLLLPNSRAEATQLETMLGVPAERIRVVPNGASERFAHATADLFFETYGLRDFVLYAGRIEPRKNQLGFLKAMQQTDLPIVVLGDPVSEYRWYYDRCRALAGSNVHFLPRFAHDSSLLASAFAACRCLALTSWFETPGLVSLEAGMSGTPLVLTQRGSAQEYFGALATYVDPRSPAEIRRAVVNAFEQPRNRELSTHVQSRYTWSAVARATWEAYQSVL